MTEVYCQIRRLWHKLAEDRGATTLEWTLLLCAIAIPSYALSMLALKILVEHYRMMTLLNSLPFP